jgi:hypothetical protein
LPTNSEIPPNREEVVKTKAPNSIKVFVEVEIEDFPATRPSRDAGAIFTYGNRITI